ncbi:MAG: STAS domain-containing protein [Syntrophobacteraceae bacterium]|jgi:anti-anti-sigma factor|nr:STAS domain-containing protein [Syntrophobacteraceae bacterium]
MELTGNRHEKGVSLKIKGRMDTLTAPEFEKECTKWMEEGVNHFVLDLGELEYISSAGLRSILLIAKKLKPNNGQICFCSPSEIVAKVFLISGFSSMFSTYDSVDEAFHHL